MNITRLLAFGIALGIAEHLWGTFGLVHLALYSCAAVFLAMIYTLAMETITRRAIADSPLTPLHGIVCLLQEVIFVSTPLLVVFVLFSLTSGGSVPLSFAQELVMRLVILAGLMGWCWLLTPLRFLAD